MLGRTSSARQRRWGGTVAGLLALLGATAVTMQASADLLDDSGCSRGRVLNVVAHQDDDLLFMNPDIQREIDSNQCSLTVFMTAGDAGAGEAYWRKREKGPRAAYALMADADNEWNSRTVTFGRYEVQYDSLVDRPDVGLVHLRAPDGGGGGFPINNSESLNELYDGKLTEIHSLDGVNAYTKAGLTDLLLDIMRTFQPDTIQTLDYSDKNRSADHSDHRTTALLTFDAHRKYKTPHRISGYMAYAVADLPTNVFNTVEDRKLDVFMAYAEHDSKVCQTTGACLNGAYDVRSFRRYKNASEQGGVQNIAPLATLSVSSQNTANGQSAAKAVNGSTKGAPIASLDEWATVKGKAGSWIYARWPNVQTIDKVVLYDRPNSNDRITAGVLSFSDGTSIKVDALPNNGEAKIISFPPKKLWTMKFTATAVSPTTRSAGLAEIQAYATTVAPQATVTTSSQNTATSQQAIRAVDGYTVGTGIGGNREWATVRGREGSWLKLTWDKPQTIGKVVLHDRPNGNDQVTGGTLTFSDGSKVTVPALPNNGGAYTLTFPKRTVTALTFTVTKVSTTTGNVGLAEIQVEVTR